MQPVHRQQQRLGEKSRKLPEIHHQVRVVLELLADVRQRPVFLRPGKEDNLPLDGLIRRQRCRRINQRGLNALRQRRARHRLDIRETAADVTGRATICAAGSFGIASSAKNWLCAAAQTTLFDPARYSVLGALRKQANPVPENQATG